MLLRRFIQAVGGLVALAGILACLFMIYIVGGHAMFHRQPVSILAGFLMLFVFLGFFGIITLAGWRIFTRWTPSTVREYAFIQGFLTGIALSQIFRSHQDWRHILPWLTAALLASPLHYVIRRCLEQTGNYPSESSEIATLFPTLPKRWF